MAIRLTSYANLPASAYPQALLAGDIDLPAGVPVPESGIVALHGLASATEVLSGLRRNAGADGYALRTVEIELELGKPDPKRLDVARLRSSRIVQLGRLDKTADAAFFQMMVRAAEARGEVVDRGNIGVFGGIVRRPDLIPDVVRAEGLKAEVVVFDVEDPTRTYRRFSVALILSAENIISASVRGLPDTEVLWPEKLPTTLSELAAPKVVAKTAPAATTRRKRAA